MAPEQTTAARLAHLNQHFEEPLGHENAQEQPSVDGAASEEPRYEVLPQWHSKPGHLRVITVGAGAAGLLVAYKMKKNFTNYDLVCYDKPVN